MKIEIEKNKLDKLKNDRRMLKDLAESILFYEDIPDDMENRIEAILRKIEEK